MTIPPQGYRFDPATDHHIFAYREQVPSWFGLKDANGFSIDLRVVAGAGCFAFMGWIMGVFFGAGLVMGLLGGMIGGMFMLFKVLQNPLYRSATGPMSGQPDEDGVITDFGAEFRALDNGYAEFYREWLQVYPHGHTGKPIDFDWRLIASIERRRYQELESPDAAYFNPQNEWRSTASRIRGRRDLELQCAECVVLVFDTGQELAVGWKLDHNGAAVLQAGLREFFGQMGQIAHERQQQDLRMSKIAPGDAPL